MEKAMENARKMLAGWKGDSYTFGFEVLGRVGDYAAIFGKKALLIVAELGEAWVSGTYKPVTDALRAKGLGFEAITGSRPNAPREDLYRLALHVARSRPDMIISLGGGSTIDAAKASNVLATYSPAEVKASLQVSEAAASTVDPYFGTGNVTKVKEQTKKAPLPMIAVQTAASSGAHLTKYSNITDLVTGQKKLIVDEAITDRKSTRLNSSHSSPSRMPSSA